MTKKTPKLRFKEFSDAWEQRKFSELLKVHPFKPYLAEPCDNGQYEVIQQGNVPVVGYADGTPCYDYEKVTVFGDHTVSLYKTKSPFFVASDGVKILSADNMDGNFFYSLLERYKPEPEGYKRHFSILKEKICFFSPNSEEQQKIGLFFSKLDNLITLHQHKLERLNGLKKAYLEKMFPKKGKLYPELRFKGFTDAWKQRKLGTLVEIGDIDHRMPPTVSEGIPYLMTGDFYGNNELNFKNVKHISKEDFLNLSRKIKPEKGDILFARYASVGAVRYVDFDRDFLISYSCAIIKKSRNINSKYLYHFLTTDVAQKQIQLEINSGSQANIGIDSLKNKIVVSIPSELEQNKISAFLTKLDNLITLHQCKLDKLKQIKSSYLNSMFI